MMMGIVPLGKAGIWSMSLIVGLRASAFIKCERSDSLSAIEKLAIGRHMVKRETDNPPQLRDLPAFDEHARQAMHSAPKKEIHS